MDILKQYQRGVNLGGWLSQYGNGIEIEHIETFITQQDIERIAVWGMDHVRLPVDYPILENEEASLYIDKCMQWCREHGFEYFYPCIVFSVVRLLPNIA